MPWAIAIAGLAALSCSKAVEAEGGGSPVGEGGGSSGTAGGGGVASACAIDCATITVPACLVATCDEATAQCIIVPTAGGEDCDDGSFCTVEDVCANGVCVGGANNDCGMAADPCRTVSCSDSTKSCAFQDKPDDTACGANNLCIVNATCQAGVCTGAAKDCFFFPVPDTCHVGTCDAATGECVAAAGNEGAACTDSGDLCSVGKTCQSGLCLGGTAKNCSAFTIGCSTGVCDPGSGLCYGDPIPTGETCNDGNACTQGEWCLNNVCQGGQVFVPVVYFTEDFSDSAAGWTLDTEWQIGPATASTGSVTGNHDPALDHTPTADNGIAGVVIGGTASTAQHAYYYLTSPIIDTSAAGPLHVAYWRWLNSDYTPYMNNVVEVYDGTTWVQVWQSGPSPAVRDTQWTKQSHDLSAYTNANMRVRFGFNIGSSGVFTVTSWNLDDIEVVSAVCN